MQDGDGWKLCLEPVNWSLGQSHLWSVLEQPWIPWDTKLSGLEDVKHCCEAPHPLGPGLLQWLALACLGVPTMMRPQRGSKGASPWVLGSSPVHPEGAPLPALSSCTWGRRVLGSPVRSSWPSQHGDDHFSFFPTKRTQHRHWGSSGDTPTLLLILPFHRGRGRYPRTHPIQPCHFTKQKMARS